MQNEVEYFIVLFEKSRTEAPHVDASHGSSEEDSIESHGSSKEDPKVDCIKQPQKAQQNYPFSVLTDVVTNKGRLPTCEGCSSQLERQAKRIVVKVPSNIKKGWFITRSYHFLRTCLTKLPQEQYYVAMRQLGVRATRSQHLQRVELLENNSIA
ncbi:hypothetical protein BCR41DRAFT_365316 [Lobosporangium transversale]|uniref:Uncharacterized protein n=1 Tax=Lobosporangium transversale TaxID=64571 RepID=A0A1Y2G9B1_9FUNG|nr:hypothetical protein BCR41DRAFT_365316 [Lobosporangium transversale]ORY94355.1 hypothetical protein BCR41DRAFT_365316 [Lobosporangium transversale]|eukprot:XP_021875295.1 hypothetical protein BCR41DRAFT_365316 [Lobosporangium transversale]